MRTQQTNSTANQTACGSELHNSMSGLISAAFFAEGLHDAGYDEVIQSWGRGGSKIVLTSCLYCIYTYHMGI